MHDSVPPVLSEIQSASEVTVYFVPPTVTSSVSRRSGRSTARFACSRSWSFSASALATERAFSRPVELGGAVVEPGEHAEREEGEDGGGGDRLGEGEAARVGAAGGAAW